MFQPEAKFQFIRRYCPPADGWQVYADIDASEEGRTGGQRKTEEARDTQERMQTEGEKARRELKKLGVQVGEGRAEWFGKNGLPTIEGDRDIVALHPASSRCLIVEVEGQSKGQPEQKLYKAIGQLIMAASQTPQQGWKVKLVLVVYGEKIAEHLGRAKALQRIDIAALALATDPSEDRWLFNADDWPNLAPGGASS